MQSQVLTVNISPETVERDWKVREGVCMWKEENEWAKSERDYTCPYRSCPSLYIYIYL